MESLRQIAAGFLLAILSLGIVLGAFALSTAEGRVTSSISPTASSQPGTATSSVAAPVITELVKSTLPPTVTEILTLTATVTQPVTPTATSTVPATSATCRPPAGWIAIVVQTSDTLDSLARSYQSSVAAIKQGNCLFSDQLVSGSYLYVPPRPTATLVPCGAPAGWVNYSVLLGDTLYKIGLSYRVSVAQLQIANCLGSSTYIQVGKIIKVPNVIPSTPIVAPTAVWTATATTPAPPAATLTDIAPQVTNTPLPADTATPEPSLTPVPTSTSTSVPPAIATPITPPSS